MNRRTVVRLGLAAVIAPAAALTALGCTRPSSQDTNGDDHASTTDDHPLSQQEAAVKIHYLEIVTPDVAAACALYSATYGVSFGDADPNLGGARTADLDGGGMLGVRGPLRDTEMPVVRPYVLVPDIDVAVAAANEAGAEIAMMPMEIPGYGQFAIIIHGGIESGLWQV